MSRRLCGRQFSTKTFYGGRVTSGLSLGFVDEFGGLIEGFSMFYAKFAKAFGSDIVFGMQILELIGERCNAFVGLANGLLKALAVLTSEFLDLFFVLTGGFRERGLNVGLRFQGAKESTVMKGPLVHESSL